MSLIAVFLILSIDLVVNKSDSRDFTRLHEAIQFICDKSVPCIQYVLQTWHDAQKLDLPPCDSPHQCSAKTNKKPKVGKFCSGCVAWTGAIQTAYYPPIKSDTQNMFWSNADISRLHLDFVEVAKTFVLRMSADNDKHVASLDQFDAASLLRLMMHFGAFHREDAILYKKITNVRLLIIAICILHIKHSI